MSRRRLPRTIRSSTDRSRPRARSASRGGGPAVGGGGGAQRCRHRCFGAASSFATAPPCSRRGSCVRCGGGARRRRAALRATRVTGIRHRRARDARGPGSCAGDRRRHERVGGRLEAAGATADAVRQLRRAHRAGAGAARRDRLDRRRGDHRLPDVPPLLPHDGRRPRADGLRLRPDRLRRQDRRALLAGRSRPLVPQPRACAGCCRASRPRRSSTRGAGRSTSSADHLPSSARFPARGSTTAPATRATASGRAGSAARCSRRSRWASTTSGRGCRSSTPDPEVAAGADPLPRRQARAEGDPRRRGGGGGRPYAVCAGALVGAAAASRPPRRDALSRAAVRGTAPRRGLRLGEQRCTRRTLSPAAGPGFRSRWALTDTSRSWCRSDRLPHGGACAPPKTGRLRDRRRRRDCPGLPA